MHTSRTVPPTQTVAPRDAGLELSLLAQAPSVPRALAAVRSMLGMDVAYTCEIAGENLTIRAVDGDGASFHVTEGTTQDADLTYCGRMLRGRLPNVIADVRAEDRAASLPITRTAGIGAFTTVPLRFADGTLYGTLCTASHQARPELGYRDLQALHVVARIVADQLERTQLKAQLGHDTDEHDLLNRTTDLRTDALGLLEAATDQRTTTDDSAVLVTHLQHAANDLGQAERLLCARGTG